MVSKGPVIITGATGFIGANLCQYFLEKGAEVIALEGVSENAWRLEASPTSPSLRRHCVDLGDESQIRSAIQEYQPSIFINCAAYGAYSNQVETGRIYKVNFEAVRIILESLDKVSRFSAFIQAGSSSEYGFNCTAPDETAVTLPDSHYAVSKLSSTALVQLFGKKYGLPAWSLRLYSIYGPLEDPSRLIPRVLISAAKRALPSLVNPEISRDFVYVRDACEAFEAVIDKSATLDKGDVFNIGSGIKTNLASLVAIVQKEFLIDEKPRWGSMKSRHWDHPEWYANPMKARRLLDWKAKTELAVGLRFTKEWMMSNNLLVELSQKYSVIDRSV